MSHDGSVAPKERVKITYKSDTGDAQEERELPLRLLVMGDFKSRPDDTPLEERPTIGVDKHNFEEVLSSQRIAIDLQVADEVGPRRNETLGVHLEIQSMRDFSPDAIARQVPEVRSLLEIREALIALKGPLSNDPRFRRLIQNAINDETQRMSILDELTTGAPGDR